MSEQQGGVTTSGPGALFAIGGAEDKLKKRLVLQEFVEAAGRAEGADRGGSDRLRARTGRDRRVLRPVRRARRCQRGRGPPGEPRGRRRPRLHRATEPGHRDLHDRRQPVEAERRGHRYCVRPRCHRGTCPGRRRWWYVGRCQHPGRAHDRVRAVRRHSAAADEPTGRPDSAWSRARSSTSTLPSATGTGGSCRWLPSPPGCSGSASTRTPLPSYGGLIWRSSGGVR